MKNRVEPKQNLIAIQDEYVARVNAAYTRWSHRKCSYAAAGGHFGRTRGAAIREGMKKLARWGFDEKIARQLMMDADSMAQLERNSDAE